jgi:sugar phosphate isomerase/epimerase
VQARWKDKAPLDWALDRPGPVGLAELPVNVDEGCVDALEILLLIHLVGAVLDIGHLVWIGQRFKNQYSRRGAGRLYELAAKNKRSFQLPMTLLDDNFNKRLYRDIVPLDAVADLEGLLGWDFLVAETLAGI